MTKVRDFANVASGLTSTATELNYNDITTLGTSEASKVVTADASGNIGIGVTPDVDLSLASGGVIAWNSSEVTITHSANALDFAGASSGYSFDDDVSFGASQSLVSGNGFEYIFNHPSSDSTRNTVALLNTSNSTQPGRFRFVKSRGAGSSNVTVADGDNIWNIQGYGDDGTSIRYTGSIDMVVSGTPSTGAVPSKMLFSTATTAGTVTTGIEISNTQDVTISNGNLTVSGQYIEEYAATGTSGAVTIDLDTGNNFSTAMAGAVTYTFSNAATSGTVSSFTLKVVNNGSAITWPTSVDWPAGTAPTLSASGATDVFVFYTHDGGTTWYGFTAGQAMA